MNLPPGEPYKFKKGDLLATYTYEGKRYGQLASISSGTRSVFYGGLIHVEGECLHRYCQAPGPHIDIGTDHGGSARTAYLAKEGSGHIYTIDPNPAACDTARSAFKSMIPNWEVGITIINNYSQTWDPPEDPTTVLIDGDHTYEGCLGDWNKYSEIATRYVLFHDNDIHEVQKVIEIAKSDKNWKLVEEAGKVTVFERVNHAWETGQELEDVRSAP